jgi:acetyl esterase/lipase
MHSVRTFLLAVAALLGASTPAQVRFHDETYAVQLQSGVLYGTGATGFSGTPGVKNLTTDVYSPVGFPSPTRPALLLVHGGSFSSGNSTSPDMVQAAQYFAARGWVCVSINYRLQGDDPPAPAWVTLFGGLAGRAGYAADVDGKRAFFAG